MDIFTKVIKTDSRSDEVHVYWLHDLHGGAPNFDEKRLNSVIRTIVNDKAIKIVFLGGDLCDLVVLRDLKRFSPDNLDDETLTGTPKQIRKNLSNLAVRQAKKIAKMLMPIKDFILGSVHGNHELSVLKSSGIDIHNMICEELGIRNCGSIGMAGITMRRKTNGRVFKVAFMHNASGGRTAGASNNSLARGLNLFSADIVLQGHNHSPAAQRIVTLDMTVPGETGTPMIVKRDRVGINNGSFMSSYMKDVNSYDQDHLYCPKSEVFYRANVRIIRGTEEGNKIKTATRTSIIIEELHV